jgi:hypothetical protein
MTEELWAITPESLEVHAQFLDDNHKEPGTSAAAAELRRTADRIRHEDRLRTEEAYERAPKNRTEYLEKALMQLWDRMGSCVDKVPSIANRSIHMYRGEVEAILEGCHSFDRYDERCSAEKLWADTHPDWVSSPPPWDFRHPDEYPSELKRPTDPAAAPVDPFAAPPAPPAFLTETRHA